jgi:hypothetical protein
MQLNRDAGAHIVFEKIGIRRFERSHRCIAAASILHTRAALKVIRDETC